jgi:hypothetical protein
VPDTGIDDIVVGYKVALGVQRNWNFEELLEQDWRWRHGRRPHAAASVA